MKFFPGNFSIMIDIKLFHEEFNFIFKRREAVSFKEKSLDFFWSDVAAVVFINSLETGFEFFFWEDVNSEGVHQCCLELIWGTQSCYTEEWHLIFLKLL